MSFAIKDLIRNFVQDTRTYSTWVNYKRKQIADKWEKSEPVFPPPNYIKERMLRDYQKKFNCDILIETGTCFGEMVFALKRVFQEIHTIELDDKLAARAKKIFLKYKHIHVHQGDSTFLLQQLLEKVNGPVLFWLDAHYSGGITAKAALNTPIVAELSTIFNQRSDENIILIDDAREFIGKNDYPTLEELKRIVKKLAPSYSFETDMDIIRITP